MSWSIAGIGTKEEVRRYLTDLPTYGPDHAAVKELLFKILDQAPDGSAVFFEGSGHADFTPANYARYGNFTLKGFIRAPGVG